MKPGKLVRDFLFGLERLLLKVWRGKLSTKLHTRGGQITQEHIVWGYRLFLDREPENETAVLGKLNAFRTTKQLRADFMTSPEFRLKNPKEFAYTNESNIVIKELKTSEKTFE